MPDRFTTSGDSMDREGHTNPLDLRVNRLRRLKNMNYVGEIHPSACVRFARMITILDRALRKQSEKLNPDGVANS